MPIWSLLIPVMLLVLLASLGRRYVLASPSKPDTRAYGGRLPATLVIPVTGNSPNLERSLLSLMRQHPAPREIMLAVWNESDPAYNLCCKLTERRTDVRLVTGSAVGASSRKNGNLLAGVAEADEESRAFVFCDAGHSAPSDLLVRLLEPVLNGQAPVTTGYHRILSKKNTLPHMLHELCVLLLHFLQAMPRVTQPWGGAMAIDRQTFERLRVADLWRENVVDDCSLAARLQQTGTRCLPVAGANVDTCLDGEDFAAWFAWWTRQLQYLRFCFPGIWMLSGVGLVLLGLSPLSILSLLLAGRPASALIALLLFGTPALIFRSASRRPAPRPLWVAVFPLFLSLAACGYIAAWSTSVITWRKVTYRVGRGGVVLEIRNK